MKIKGTIYKGYEKQGSEIPSWDYDVGIEIDGLFENVYDFIKLLEKHELEFREIRS